MKEKVKSKTKFHKKIPARKKGEFISPNVEVDVRKVIDVQHIFEGKTKGWVRTQGMEKYGMPELEMRGIPTFMGPAACLLINEVCDYMLNSEDVTFRPGQVYDFGGCVFRLSKSIPIKGHEAHFDAERWMFEEVEMICDQCRAEQEAKKKPKKSLLN